MFAGGCAIHLTKGLKNVRDFIFGDAYTGICHFNNPFFRGKAGDICFYRSIIGEFDRIVNQVDQDLLQACIIPFNYFRQGWIKEC